MPCPALPDRPPCRQQGSVGREAARPRVARSQARAAASGAPPPARPLMADPPFPARPGPAYLAGDKAVASPAHAPARRAGAYRRGQDAPPAIVSQPSKSSLPPWQSSDVQRLELARETEQQQHAGPRGAPGPSHAQGGSRQGPPPARGPEGLPRSSSSSSSEGGGAGPEQQEQLRDTAVDFNLQHRVEYGQRLRVIGSHQRLGEWRLGSGVDLGWNAGDQWRASVSLPSGNLYEYKYVVMDGWGQHAIDWQQGNNSVLALSPGEERVEVRDNWWGAPGAEVKGKGGRTATRENRLLAWAGEVEAVVTQQRQELRAVREELSEAQEDSRRSRAQVAEMSRALDASRQTATVAEQRLERSEADLRRSQELLAEQSASYHHILDIAQTLLSEVYEESLSDEEDEDGEEGGRSGTSAGPGAGASQGSASAWGRGGAGGSAIGAKPKRSGGPSAPQGSSYQAAGGARSMSSANGASHLNRTGGGGGSNGASRSAAPGALQAGGRSL